MDIRIKPAPLKGSIPAIPSKSHAQRVLIAASVADRPTVVHLGTSRLSDDIRAAIGALRALGASFKSEGESLVVTPVKRWVPDQVNHAAIAEQEAITPVIPCGESGTVARLLLPVAAALYEQAVIDGEGSLAGRPFEALCAAMEQNGCRFQSKKLPVVFSGRLKPGDYRISGNESSQYISGLMFALPLLDADSAITLTSSLQSSGYVDMTIDVLRMFGIETGYKVRGRQQGRSPGQVDVEGDWSNAAFWHTAGVKVTGLNDASLQKDRLFMAVRDRNRIDISEIPDLAPILAVYCAAKEEDTVLENIERLRLKESDRVNTVERMLASLGVEAADNGHEMFIRGKGKGGLRGGVVDSGGDHRIAMAAAIASCYCKEDVIIRGAQAADKSYIGFFEDFRALGGEMIVL